MATDEPDEVATLQRITIEQPLTFPRLHLHNLQSETQQARQHNPFLAPFGNQIRKAQVMDK